MIRITILYDNETRDRKYMPAWGFSCLVEWNNATILFDTGGSGDLLIANMAALKRDPASIDIVFISHDHWDHTGGLRSVLAYGSPELCLPASCTAPTGAGSVIRISESSEIMPGVFSSGELMDFEQSMFLSTSRGAVAIAGCSHPGVRAIFNACPAGPVRALVGGLHGFSDFELLRGLELICPTHCTAYREEILRRFTETAVPGGVGRVIEIAE